MKPRSRDAMKIIRAMTRNNPLEFPNLDDDAAINAAKSQDGT